MESGRHKMQGCMPGGQHSLSLFHIPKYTTTKR